jgi:hypothetical protein
VAAGGPGDRGQGPQPGHQRLRALVVTAAPELREQLRELPATKLAATAAQLEPGPILTTTAATKLALCLLGERCAALDAELARLTPSWTT